MPDEPRYSLCWAAHMATAVTKGVSGLRDTESGDIIGYLLNSHAQRIVDRLNQSEEPQETKLTWAEHVRAFRLTGDDDEEY